MDQDILMEFAAEWLRDWNNHDLNAIMAHYDGDISFTSPLIKALGFDEKGVIMDKSILQDYFAAGLKKYPDLHFKLKQVLCGVSSVVLYYESIGGRLSAEFMELNVSGKVCRVVAHYATAS